MYKRFSGTQELIDPHSMDNQQFAASFPGVKGLRYDSFTKWVGSPIAEKDVRHSQRTLLPVTRCIHYSDKPSLHKCGGKCRSAKGHDCECSCGGQFHGAGN